MIKKISISFLLLIGSFYGSNLTNVLYAQENSKQEQSKFPDHATLQDCINFALQNRVSIKQAWIDEEIGEREIASALSGWFPQIAATANYNNNIIIPTTVIGDQTISMGQTHNSGVILQAEQQILNPALLQASKAAKYVRQKNAQQTETTEINTIVEVSKAYYDLLTSHEQLNIIQENINRIQKQLDDATLRYETGIVDKTDFKRAQISLSNAKSDLKRVSEVLNYKYAYLKELIGLQTSEMITLSFDHNAMEREIVLDTTLALNYEDRIEYQTLQTIKQLQEVNTQYNKWSFLPKVSASYNYAWDFRDNQFNGLYNQNFPRSVFGVNLSLPIFQGTKRIQEIRKSKLQEERIDWDLIQLQQRINSEYQLALATYKANLLDWKTSRENAQLSQEVYDVIRLQYNEGIKTYLDLMMAETELRTSQINELNALFAVLSGKLDATKALGKIKQSN